MQARSGTRDDGAHADVAAPSNKATGGYRAIQRTGSPNTSPGPPRAYDVKVRFERRRRDLSAHRSSGATAALARSVRSMIVVAVLLGAAGAAWACLNDGHVVTREVLFRSR